MPFSYTYGGDQIIETSSCEEDLTNCLFTRSYIYSDRIDETLTFGTSNTVYYHHDALGNTVALTDKNGNLKETYQYDPYGKPHFFNASGELIPSSTLNNPYLFTGREYDPETQLYYYRARYHNARIGRFMQRDPIGYVDNMNLFEYVGNDPVNWRDPRGLLKPGGQWPLYNAEDYENGKNTLRDEFRQRYPWMQDKDAESLTNDIMEEMTIPEAKKLKDFEKQEKEKEAEDLLKEICERTGANCSPEEDPT